MVKLFIVGTPIGNLDDITLRAIKILEKVDVIACEDTRITRQLLSHFDLKNKKLLSYNDHNEKTSALGLIKLIKSGKLVAIVSDAGMPVVSDPGFEIIKQVIKNNIQFELIPGVSSVITTMILSNFDTHFKFLGFLKFKTGQRKNQLKLLTPGTYIVFVSPYKLLSTLEDIKNVLGENTNIFLGRELTKKFESHYRGTIVEVIKKVQNNIKGEFTMAIEIKKRKINKYD